MLSILYVYFFKNETTIYNLFFLFQNHHEFVLKKQVADDYYDLFVSQLVFRKFRKGIMILKKELEFKWKKASLYYNR